MERSELRLTIFDLVVGLTARLVWSTWSGHTEQHHIELHRKYGPVVRIAPNEVSFASPRAALELFKTGKGFHKTDFYWVFPPPENPDIFTEIREDVHAVKKRYATKPYSLGALRAHVPRIEDTGQLLIQKLDGFVEKPRCDLGEWLHFFAFDVLGEVAFSQKFGFLEAGVDVDNCIRTIDDSQVYNGIVGCVPFWDYFLRRNPLWRLVPTLSTGNALITRVAQTQLESRQKLHRSDKSGGSKDLLDGLIEAQREHPEALSDGDVFAIAHGAIFAGSDSTASTMQSFFWHVLSDARVYGRLTDEMQSATLSEFVTYNEASGLPYFQACLKEAMRMRPAVGVNISRKVPPEGAEIDGTWLPGGVSVAVNGWVLHRDREVFGQDADTYRPERWIESEDAEKLRMMERCMFQVSRTGISWAATRWRWC